ncbi:hypothetical protein SORBI_3004G272000 [Sorghum bicolor]|uniref:Uncharacterized protein n=1 Tax=Sorghum bicolor TaxID=4558 RepID=A0A194YRZ4_SORBI|nr:hypothetical protein SORBI_3004G272000 [Sorghum bicolor]
MSGTCVGRYRSPSPSRATPAPAPARRRPPVCSTHATPPAPPVAGLRTAAAAQQSPRRQPSTDAWATSTPLAREVSARRRANGGVLLGVRTGFLTGGKGISVFSRALSSG